jgi:hypothetical protein
MQKRAEAASCYGLTNSSGIDVWCDVITLAAYAVAVTILIFAYV